MAQSQVISGETFPTAQTATALVPVVYSLRQRRLAFAASLAAGVIVAGFWNPGLVDGFGREVVAARTVGDSRALGDTFGEHGFGFGFLFAAAAGLAATFTACNCVVFAMLPGLAAGGGSHSRRPALRALAVFTVGVLLVSAIYGVFIGLLGADGIQAFNGRAIRSAQSRTVFSALGAVLLVWGAAELGLMDGLRRRLSPETRAFLAEPATKAGLLGLLVGAFSIGRPFPVMRDFLTYAASAESPAYGAAVMMVQGLGQIAVMVGLLLVLVYGAGRRLTSWAATRPHQVALVSAVALVAGGTFFLYYWGLARAFDIGRWGAKLGWY
jgi:sulfite exporter TauE/SafE